MPRLDFTEVREGISVLYRTTLVLRVSVLWPISGAQIGISATIELRRRSSQMQRAKSRDPLAEGLS